MKLFLLGLVCISSTFIGIYVSKEIKNRERFFLEWIEYNKFLIQRISFFKEPIYKITKDFYKDRKDSLFVLLLKDYINNKTINCFKKDKIKIQEYFNTLGSLDYTNQLNYLKSELINLEEKYKEVKLDMKTKGNLYPKLGLIIGIALMILMV